MARNVGDVVRLKAVFTVEDVLVDPTTVTFTVKDPDKIVAVAPNTRTGLGRFQADVNITKPGRWYYRVASTGTGTAAEESSFDVVESTVL